MKDIAILMPCWKCPELLRISIPSILKSITTNSELILILNEVDEESLKIVKDYGITHIDLKENFGPAAVDFAISYIKEKGFRYVTNVNSDMLFSPSWDVITMRILEERKPCSVSATLVENHVNAIQPIRVHDDLGNFYDPKIIGIFNENVKNGKYKTIEMIACSHPITVTIEDFLAVGGYSDNMDKCWIEVRGRLLDPYFGYRLYKLYNGKFGFIRTNEVFVYHEASTNRKKFGLVGISDNAAQYFMNKTGMTFSDFNRMAKINA
jgi:glycosyltransferase involved in cell wall biosynthesis